MPKLSDIHIAVSPLTDKVFIGTVARPGVFKDKVDATAQFCGALLGWVPPGTSRTVVGGGKTFEIIVREARSRVPVLVHCKLGTIPARIYVWGNRTLTTGKRFRFRMAEPGSKWETGRVESTNTDGYAFISRI